MEVDWNTVLGEVVTQVLKILVPVCVAVVLKWAAEIWLKVKEAKPELASVIEMAAKIGYATAEEYFRQEVVDGVTKMEYAKEQAQNYLLSLGMNIDLDTIEAAITEYGVEHNMFSWVQDRNRQDFAKLMNIPSEKPEEGMDDGSNDNNTGSES